MIRHDNARHQENARVSVDLALPKVKLHGPRKAHRHTSARANRLRDRPASHRLKYGQGRRKVREWLIE